MASYTVGIETRVDSHSNNPPIVGYTSREMGYGFGSALLT